MQTTLIDGKALANSLSKQISQTSAVFARQAGRTPGLAVVLVGDDPASEVYVRSKVRKARELGFESVRQALPADITQSDLHVLIQQLNADETIDGILLQLPLPAHLDELAALQTLDPDKDVDGLHPDNAGRLFAGRPRFVSCTPLGCLRLLKDQLGELSGLDAIVIGRSVLVGNPMAQLLVNENCTVTTAHSKTQNLKEKVRQADIVVSAVGKPSFVKGDWIKPGATLIDVGTTKRVIDGRAKLLGDIDFHAVFGIAHAVTPVPGGVGPMTIMMLMHNTLLSAYRRAGMGEMIL